MTLPAQDIVERLRRADANSQQRVLGSRIFGEAADTISRLTADNEALRKERDELEKMYLRQGLEAFEPYKEQKARADALAAALDDMLLEYGDRYDSECRLKNASELDMIAKARSALGDRP